MSGWMISRPASGSSLRCVDTGLPSSLRMTPSRSSRRIAKIFTIPDITMATIATITLRERIKVLERIATDGNSLDASETRRISREIEALRDRQDS